MIKRQIFAYLSMGTLIVLFGCTAIVKQREQEETAAKKSVYAKEIQKLLDEPYNERGDRLIDFSGCGFMGGAVAIPDVPVRKTLSPDGTGDQTERIQAAIDKVSALPVDAEGYRGAVLLKKGFYPVAGSLTLHTGGVVLRGEGKGKDGTILYALRDGGKRVLISVAPDPKGRLVDGIWDAGTLIEKIADSSVEITAEVVPVGSRGLRVEDASGFIRGDDIIVLRRVNDAWIHAIGMDDIPKRPGNPEHTQNWTPRQYHMEYQRKVEAIDGDEIILDVPIVDAIEKRWGGGEVVKIRDGRVRRIGIEKLRMVSEFDPEVIRNGVYADENRCNSAVSFINAADCWARDLVTVHFQTATSTSKAAKNITVQDCASLLPVSVITGGRRVPFHMGGQQSLIQRCFAEYCRHGYSFGSRVPGPNVILDVMAIKEFGASEPHHRWSTGGLFDNLKGNLAIENRQWMGSGQGWAGANYVAWNTEGNLTAQSPPTASNFSVGHVGNRGMGLFQNQPQGAWISHGRHVNPRSLYLAQLRNRLGGQAVLNISTEAQRQGPIYEDLAKQASEGEWNSRAPHEFERGGYAPEMVEFHKERWEKMRAKSVILIKNGDRLDGINDKIDERKDAHRLVIEPGTYRFPADLTIDLGNINSVEASNDGRVIFDGNGEEREGRLFTGGGVVFKNITFQHFKGRQLFAGGKGAGMQHVTFDTCSFTRNQVAQTLLHMGFCARLTLRNCRFEENIGGQLITSTSHRLYPDYPLIIENCVFEDNNADPIIYTRTNVIQIDDSKFLNNAGRILSTRTDANVIKVKGCEFTSDFPVLFDQASNDTSFEDCVYNAPLLIEDGDNVHFNNVRRAGE